MPVSFSVKFGALSDDDVVDFLAGSLQEESVLVLLCNHPDREIIVTGLQVTKLQAIFRLDDRIEVSQMMNRQMVHERRMAMLNGSSSGQSPFPDWAELRGGDPVEIITHAHVVAAGLVEEVSLSGSVLWIKPKAAEMCRLFLKSDGVLVRRA